MKVLLLPLNIGSLPSITADALNQLPGVEAVCITNLISPIQTKGPSTIFIPKKFPRRKPFLWLYHKLSYKTRIKKWIKWADVLHYFWEPAFQNAGDLQLALKMNKPIFVEWLGSDIREPQSLFKINKYYKDVFDKGYEYRYLESSGHAQWVQKEFSKAGALPLLVPEMSLFLDSDLFPAGCNIIMQRMNIRDFVPNYPNPDKVRPLIIHSPSAKVCKGTEHILKVVEKLKKEFEFDFRLVENLSREQALQLMSQCDIFVDQLIIGSYGAASIEAMSFGKPALCFIMPEVFLAGLPSNCPIVNTNPDNLKEQLSKLLQSGHCRNEIGKKGRAYVEKYHDASTIAQELKRYYQKELERKKQNRNRRETE